MAIPRVFISSTCYDLKHIRESLKYFVRTLGYEPVLSDEGDVFYSPVSHTHDACLKEVETCQIFILIIGGRYGSNFKDSEQSITNHEYRSAISLGIPVFALVEDGVYSDNHLFISNKSKNPSFYENIDYPSVDSIMVFDFIDEVKRKVENNAIQSFKDFTDIEGYLKKQWAGMMYDFIVNKKSEKSSSLTNNLLDKLTMATKKTEGLLELLVRSSENLENKDGAIESVSSMIEAEKFLSTLESQFNMTGESHIFKESLVKGNIGSDSWIDFLISTGDFYIHEDFHEDFINEECVEIDLKILFYRYNKRGVCVEESLYAGFKRKSINNLQKLYESFKGLKRVDRNKALQEYDLPF